MRKGWHIYTLVHDRHTDRWRVGIAHYTGERDRDGDSASDKTLQGDFSPAEFIALLRPHLTDTTPR